MIKIIKKLRRQLLIWLAHDIALPYFKLVRRNYNFPYSLQQLRQFPTGTVGYELYLFFSDHDLDMLPHYEKHDIKHVVLGFPPSEAGEVCLQCFMLANGRITLPVVFSVIIGLLILPECWPACRKAWKQGWATPSLHQLDWFALVPQPLSEVREQLQLQRS